MSGDPQGVMIVDDDEAVRESLSALLRADGLRVRSFASAEDFLSADIDSMAGCAIVDLHMPGLTGLQLQAELAARQIALPVIVITGQSDVATAVAALKGGAIDYLEKPYNADALLRVVREALERAGRLRQDASIARDLQSRLGQLSPREREVMDLMVAGHPNKVIGVRLGISSRTVENHRARVMDKMACGNLPELIHLSLLLQGPGAIRQ